jgi:hypothetical protein
MCDVAYLKDSLVPLLVDAVAEVCLKHPKDPIEYIALFLKSKVNFSLDQFPFAVHC